MIFEGPLGKGKEIVDVGSNEIQAFKELRHFLLKDVRAVAQTHRQTLHLKLSKGKDQSAQSFQVWQQLDVTVAHVQIQTSRALKPF